MEYTLGEPRDSIRNLQNLGHYQKLGVGTPYTDSLYYGDIPLASLKLFFWDGRLHSIEVKTEGTENTDKLLQLFKIFYGEGENQDHFGNRINWDGKMAVLAYEKNLLWNDGTFTFTSREVHARYVEFMNNRTFE